MSLSIQLMEAGLIPDALIRLGIRRNCAARLAEQSARELADKDTLNRFAEELKNSPIALVPEKANEQHYEVPAEFFSCCLGAQRKYSSCYYDDATSTLDQAEEKMLALSAERAGLSDGQNILELGCGWGSFTLWMAKQFPQASITAVSNSQSQRAYIETQARVRGFKNISVLTCDMNDLTLSQRFDRVVSIEMFEHMRNYKKLLHNISTWLKPEGKLFVHIFCHKKFAYPYETAGAGNWLGRYFFTGGIMPSDHLLYAFDDDMRIEKHWQVSGVHYQKTSEAWLQNLDRNKTAALEILRHTYGKDAQLWFRRWRIFFMACAELFGYRGGGEWFVSHYLFVKR